MGSARLPVEQFVSFVCHAPPGTAVYHERGKGWTVTDHLLAQAVDALNASVWMKTTDAHTKNPKHRPEPTPRPGARPARTETDRYTTMTVADYASKAGITVAWEQGGEQP